jgi:hypothetical protein
MRGALASHGYKMEIKISYSKIQLERAIEFIAEHNDSFYGQVDYIRQSILESIEQLAKDPQATYLGTMGFTLIADREIENLDCDENIVRIDILVDPALGDDDMFLDEDHYEEVINAPATSIWKRDDITGDGI